MPAAAVIPAPLAYTIIVAVKRLVVGLNKLKCILHTYIYIIVFLDTHIRIRIKYIFVYLCREIHSYMIYGLRIVYFIFQHCEQIRVYQTCRFLECALNVLSWDVAIFIINLG